MPPRISIIGNTYGRLTIVRDRDERGALLGTPENRQVIARCQCGAERRLSARSIRRGKTTSCGCAQREAATTHGLSSHPLYAVLGSMKQRCYRPEATMYRLYGARGIRICDEWFRDPTVFIRWAKANGYRPGLQIDRIDNDGDYEPRNCRFVSRTKNARNKRDNRRVEYRGQSISVAAFAELIHQPYHTVYQRITRLGWDPDRVATTLPRRLRSDIRQAAA